MAITYRAVKWSRVFDSVVRAKGLDPATASLTAAQQENMADLVNEWLRQAWEFAWWPALMVCEQRTVTADEDAGLVITPAEDGCETIGHVRAVYKTNPRTGASPYRLPFLVTADGIILPSTLGITTAFVEHRVRAPEFTRVVWSAATTYAAGDLVYLAATGECYRAVAASTNKTPPDAAYWEAVLFPWWFAGYVRNMALAQWLWEDEQRDKAVDEEARAEAQLLRMRDVEVLQQGQHETASVVV
jgi:hypothetical protein